jgi:predicted kinase
MSYLFGQDEDLSARPQPNERPDLPTTFGETFAAQWSQNEIFSQDYFGEHDRFSALQDYLDNIKQRGGPNLGPELDYGDTSGIGIMPAAQSLLAQTNDKLAAFKQKNPTFDVQPMTADELEQNAVAKRRKADADFQTTMARERGPGATLGKIAGGIVTGFADPINLALLPVAPEESLGIVANAIRWGVIGGAGAAASAALKAPYREEVEPGYVASGQPIADIATATGETAIGGLIFRGVADAWSRVRTGAWPESVKQAGNVVTGQANTIATNVYPGPEGEVAHAQALSKASDDILRSYPVDVSKFITPERDATATMAPAEAARTQAQAAATAAAQARAAMPTGPAPELPFARTAAEAEAEMAKQAVSADVQQRARTAAAPYAMPAEEAARVTDKLMAASPEEAQDMLRDLHMSPRQVADAPRRIEAPAEPQPVPVTPLTKATPEFEGAMRADLDRELLQTVADYRAAGFTAEEAQALAVEHMRPYAAQIAPEAGSKEELQQLIEQKAPREQIINHPFVQDYLRRAQELAKEPTGTAEDFANPEWRAKRVYNFDGVPVQGFDNAADRLMGRFETFAGPEGVANERRAVLVTGPPASGKSTFAEPLARELRAAIPDPDEAKLVIPEYQGGLGSLKVHAESSRLAREITANKLAPRGANLVIPTVGATPEHLQNVMQLLKQWGYTVDLMHVSAGAEVASRRNIQRLINTGRLVEPDYLLEAAAKTGPTAYVLREKGLIRDFADIDTSGETPVVRGGEGPLADMVRNGRYLAQRPGGGPERIFGEAEGLRSPGAIAGAEGRAPPVRAPENLIPNIDEQPVSLAGALREVDGYKAAAEQLAACGAPVAAEAA